MQEARQAEVINSPALREATNRKQEHLAVMALLLLLGVTVVGTRSQALREATNSHRKEEHLAVMALHLPGVTVVGTRRLKAKDTLLSSTDDDSFGELSVIE